MNCGGCFKETARGAAQRFLITTVGSKGYTMKISLEDFDYITTVLFCAQDSCCDYTARVFTNPREDAAKLLIRVALTLTGEVYQPGHVFPEPKNPKTLGDVRKNLLIFIANELSKSIDSHIYDLEKALKLVYAFVDSIYPDNEDDKPRGNNDGVLRAHTVD